MKNSEFELSEGVLKEIKDRVAEELGKRGFHAPLKISQRTSEGKTTRIELESEPFQTVPVLFKSLKVHQFSQSVSRDKETPALLRIWLCINVGWQRWGGGQNGTELFQFRCVVREDREDIYDVQIW